MITIPLWSLLGFATWTILLLLFTVGIYRWSRILTGRAPIKSFGADQVEGEDWYKRSMRAHANCVENLPVYAAIVLALYAGEVGGPMFDGLALTVLIARVLQSTVHVAFQQSNAAVAIRFTFFFVQIVAFLWLIALIFLARW